jgi:hypothetical protein
MTIDFFPTDYEGRMEVLLTSPRFQTMSYFERQNAVWDYLLNDPQVNKDAIFTISRVAMEAEAAELN